MNNTLTNGLLLLEYLADSGKAYAVSDIATAFSLPKSHACRLLKTLTDSGYVEQDTASRKYRISLKILTLSHACLLRLGIRDRLRPMLKELSRTLGQAVFLQAPLEGKALIIDVEYPSAGDADTSLVIGGTNPMHASAGGKLCAAYADPASIDRILTATPLEKLGKKTITDPKSFRKHLTQIRQDGVAVMDDERGPGVGAVAAPVFDCEGVFIAALGVVMPQGPQPRATWEQVINETKAAAAAASYALGFGKKNLV